jgi:hypothetical protein
MPTQYPKMIRVRVMLGMTTESHPSVDWRKVRPWFGDHWSVRGQRPEAKLINEKGRWTGRV